MAKLFLDAVAQTTASTGTGNITLVTPTPYPGRRTLQSTGVATGTKLSYRIAAVDNNGQETGDWETGEGTYLGAGSFERTTPRAGSAAVPVAFVGGTKKVTFTVNAADLDTLAELDAGATLTWNTDGTLATVTTNGTTYTMAYATVDDFPRLTSITGGGKTVALGYDGAGRLTSIG
ncbi:hypothetical protein [Azohydromonas aeria]|uniref:hypothetical protein n=1 Tax=Azohydromonas aeria TaxID=2590212 RepID=UPI0012F7BD6E|nr:hypothetical protein [Azohydromonas aeria]